MMQVPKNIFYTRQHLWLQKIGMYDFYVGITDFGQKEIGEIDLIELTNNVSSLKKDASWGVVYGINDTFQLIAPFDCEIIEKNKNLHKETAYLNTAPYEHWLAILTTKVETTSLLTFQDYAQYTHAF